MVVRLQRWIVFSCLVAAIAWTSFWWSTSPLVAAVGILAVTLAHSTVLAMEFMVAHRINAEDTVPGAGVALCMKAWLAESWMALRVFCWQQPFRSGAIPDHLPSNSRRGAVLLHGFLCNRGFWNPWLRELRSADRAFIAVNLEPVFGAIDCYTEIIDAAIARVTEVTGQPPILICHSMGGLAARAWLRDFGGARVHRIVTLGTPHRGTWMARFSRSLNGQQMRIGSEWLRRLEGERSGAHETPFTCWASNCDNIVFPASTATLPGADNRLLEGRGHVEMAFDTRLRQQTLALFDR
jgi:pimeloyl-ACP methyl ester carboxylesterase